MNLSETTSGRANTIPECSVSKDVIKPEPEYSVWEGFGDIPPRVVALENLSYSLKVLVFGKAVKAGKSRQDYSRRD
jgi:hypothetical protein